jgi:uncharacterized protein
MRVFKIIFVSFIFLIALDVFLGSPLFALEVPALKGRVNDYAGILSNGAQHQLETVLADLERTDSTQIVVLTIPSLEGDSLEDFSIRVAEQWKIGQKSNDNGAILIISKKDRKIRIEAGYGLEGKLTDLMCGRIIRNVITPNFKSGDFDAGVIQGVSAMIGTVKGLYTAEPKPTRTRRRSSSPGVFGFFALFFIINMLGRVNRPLGAVSGGIILPILGAALFGLGLVGILTLIPVGLFLGLIVGSLGGVLNNSHSRHRSSSGGGFWMGGGGFGGGGFGGFSGGGGGFGGGGASGGW